MTAVAPPEPELTIVVADVVAADPLLRRRRSYVLLALTESLTGKDRDHLHRELARFSTRRSTHFLLDLSAITDVDQAGINALHYFDHHLDSIDRWLIITTARLTTNPIVAERITQPAQHRSPAAPPSPAPAERHHDPSLDDRTD